jgi:hypothetical protein
MNSEPRWTLEFAGLGARPIGSRVGLGAVIATHNLAVQMQCGVTIRDGLVDALA